MVEQNKNTVTNIENLAKVISHLGVTVMLAATVVSMVEIAQRESNRVVATLQPSYAFAGHDAAPTGHGDEQSRRGKEEIRHTSASYGEMRRQHSVAGTL